MKILYLIRGVPGAGKSTLANKLTASVAEADQFMVDASGEYKFDASKLPTCHAACRHLVETWMKLGEHPIIAVANTFIKRWEMEPYLRLSEENGYTVIEISLTGQRFVNVHGVPADIIERMRRNFEI